MCTQQPAAVLIAQHLHTTHSIIIARRRTSMNSSVCTARTAVVRRSAALRRAVGRAACLRFVCGQARGSGSVSSQLENDFAAFGHEPLRREATGDGDGRRQSSEDSSSPSNTQGHAALARARARDPHLLQARRAAAAKGRPVDVKIACARLSERARKGQDPNRARSAFPPHTPSSSQWRPLPHRLLKLCCIILVDLCVTCVIDRAGRGGASHINVQKRERSGAPKAPHTHTRRVTASRVVCSA